MGIPVEDTEALVASLDKDGDGLLRFDDFVKLMEGENEQDRLNCLEEAIEMYDMDDFVLLNSKTNRGTNLIPVSRKDLKNIAFKQKPLFCTTIGKVLDIFPQQHWMLLMLFGSILSYLAKNSTTSFEFQFGKTTKTPHLLLSFKEAFSAFSPEMAHITNCVHVMLYFELGAGFTTRTWNADIFGATTDFCTSALFS
ncbi:unnamed protein product [Trifolium pratense]|uniref:Uncharacterized protein n=1 Tax=Trifolium pratense TaxID=57577 RepID=A0ACB0JN71_TRIPR|nr:unnamed protein product [Trifolium pratense]